MRIVSDRRYHPPVDPGQVWDAFDRVDQYQRWWPWLEAFDGERLEASERWSCVVRPPLPYRVRFTVVLEEVTAPTTVAAAIEGDITGTARIDLSPDGGGSALRLRAELSPRNRALQVLATVARPVVTFGHDWVLDTGVGQFTNRLARPTPPESTVEVIEEP